MPDKESNPNTFSELQKGYQPLKEGYQANDTPLDTTPPTGGSALSPASGQPNAGQAGTPLTVPNTAVSTDKS